MSSGPGRIEASPRFGHRNPESVHNDLWQRAIRNHWSAHDVRQHLIGLAATGAVNRDVASKAGDVLSGPFWSWRRYGRTRTSLPDGRRIHVGGEHEDWYDPDFCIYNDVVVEHPGGRSEIYLYPREVFPPTDFHTATLVGTRILLVGSLGYKEHRQPGKTQVVALDTHSYRIAPLETTGPAPGWISRHKAETQGASTIRLTGGQVITADNRTTPNHDDYVLDLSRLRWKRS